MTLELEVSFSVVEGSGALDSETFPCIPALSGVAGEWDMLLRYSRCFSISLATTRLERRGVKERREQFRLSVVLQTVRPGGCEYVLRFEMIETQAGERGTERGRGKVQ